MATNVVRPQSVPIVEVDVTWMIGHSLAAVAFSEPTHWTFSLTGGGAITTDGLWRVVVGPRLVVTSEDHGHRFGMGRPLDAVDAARRIVSSKIVDVLVVPATSDLILRMEGESELQLLTSSVGYEAWQLEAPDGRSFVVDGSGNASTWRTLT